MPSLEDIIHDVLREEGDKEVNDPLDHGGRTKYGISERANPEAWADGQVTDAEAREIYYRKYVIWPRFDKIADPALQAQLVDFGVNSGPQLAIMKLQAILGVDVDGIIGPITLSVMTPLTPELFRHLNNRLVQERVLMIGRIVKRDPSQLKFLNGWLDRALGFIR